MTGTKTEAVCALDMATLRVCVGDNQRVEVFAATGELLARYDSLLLAEEGWEENPGRLVLESLDEVLAGAFVLRRFDEDVQRCRVALLNPFTGEVALGALPKTEVFKLASPVPSSGEVLQLSSEGLLCRGEPLERVEMRRDGLVRAALAHAG
jgi:hypothetical protein